MILEMKRFLVLRSLFWRSVLFSIAIFQRPYMVPIIEEVSPNETAFLVALEGDSKTNQAKMDSVDLY